MALFNTINFLPQVFQSATNQRFLGATLDQLVTDPVTVPINGYIGRRFSPTYKVGDNYVPELTAQRQNYQLEPSAVVKDTNRNVEFVGSYIDLLNSINNNNGTTNNHQRLFNAESYNYDGKFDYDKFVNYYNYYWLPNGPTAVPVITNSVPYVQNFAVTRNTTVGGYTFTGTGSQPNVQLTLARGGTYTFTVNQPGINFWLQSSPGVNGTDPNISTINTRQIFGVKNNGTDNGQITFNVPLSTAQDFYTQKTIPPGGSVNAALNLHYTDIQNQSLNSFLQKFPDGFDGITNAVLLRNTTFIFISNDQDDVYWTTPKVADGLLTTAQVAASVISEYSIINKEYRPSVWKINLVPTVLGNDYVIQLTADTPITAGKDKVFVQSGKTYASNQFWLDNTNRYQLVPLITATKDYLYYQDSNNPDFFGQIKLVDNLTSTIDIAKDIIGSMGYVSPNGVIFTNGLKIAFDSFVTPSTYANKEFYVEGVGTNIKLVPVEQMIVPENFGKDIATIADYITVSKASLDRNPWTRSNRWFHKDVILKTAGYNNTPADYGPNIPGRRPIIEFNPGLQLFNYGVEAKNSVDYIVLESTDAFLDIEGQITASIDGNVLKNGDRVIFTNDYDITIINEVWQVKIELINNTNYITLLKTGDDPILSGQNVLVTNGNHAGKTYRYTGSIWHECQEKTSANQAPLFDLVDADGYSFSDTTAYPLSSFAGSTLFGYKVGTGKNDLELGFPLSYKNFNNIGDIVFNNYYDFQFDAANNPTTAIFTYKENQTTVSRALNSGYMVVNNGLLGTEKVNNWVKTLEDTTQYQIFTKFFDGNVVTISNIEYAFVQIDVLPSTQTYIPHLKVYLNNQLLVTEIDYQIVNYGAYKIVTLNTLPTVGNKIDVAVFSADVSATAYYEIPENLNYNPLNENFTQITLGQLRLHYNKLIENTASNLTNNIPLQDHYIKQNGGTLIQHSAPMVYAMTFLNDPTVNFVNGLNLARKEYAKFKNKFLTLCSTGPNLSQTDVVIGVDSILKNINAVKNSSFPWYYSDMVPQGSEYNTITYTVLNARQVNYQISVIFDNTKLSNRAVLVYVNGQQQTLNKDFKFSSITPEINFLRSFVVGDVITIREYNNTDGNYIPETPTKLGLYPKFAPEIYIDDTYQTPVTVIRGHDGSITPAFGDFRDQYLLELELRIYNNIKTNYDANQLNLYTVLPGRFRTTDYTLEEYTAILSQNFLGWVGTNSVDYVSNTTYDGNNSWTWNYANYNDTVDNSKLQGSWRAIFNYWYDTDTPHLTPWVMLGFNDRPTWWNNRYGVGPYTGGNSLLWQDLEAGYIWNDGISYYDAKFARPNLTKFIPVDTAGNLISPASIPLTNTPTSSHYNTAYSSADFSVGQQGPAETAWRRSSDYPYAVQLTLALTKPAKYFATQLDTSRFVTNPVTGQFSNSNNQHIAPGILTVNGNASSGTIARTSGYINWIADSIKNLGIDPVSKITQYFSNLNTQLSYKVAGFTDPKILTISAEQTTPGSKGASVIIPDSNYNVYLNKSVPVLTAVYSAVIVEKTMSGYSITGYDPTNPFFTIIPSIANSKTTSVLVNDVSIQLYQDSSNIIKTIPYGTEFSNIQQIADFLISYERYLVAQGFSFTQFDQDLQSTRNWSLSVREFLYWVQQGWAPGTIIVLNPTATVLQLTSTNSIVDEVTNVANGNKLLDQNFLPIKNNDFTLVRTENAGTNNNFIVKSLNGAMIAYARLNLVQYEHTIIFDNVDDFGDIIYIPSQGTRQYRLKLSGYKTGAWDGALSAPGYIYNSPIINPWVADTDYRLGDIVEYNNFYYTATQDITASTTFNSLLWTQIQKDSIQTGLLPNFGFNAAQFNRIYDVDYPPISETFQAYSASLIGFRQRQYLTDLGIGVPTQTKFYQGFIKEKGSMNAIDALTKANFNNVQGNISVYEEWAFRTGLYGGINSNNYSEFVLDQSVFTTNPVTFTVADTYGTGNIIVDLTLANIYTASNTSSTNTAMYLNRVDNKYIRDLPDIGYVNLTDVDYTIFDINNIVEANSIIQTVGNGDKVWVAKDINNKWEILRINATHLHAEAIEYTLDSYGLLKFDNGHNFNVGDLVLIKYFNDMFDGVYEIHSIPNSTSVVIRVTDPMALQTLIQTVTVTGSGIVYILNSAKVATVSELITTTPPLNGWKENDHIWIDRVNSNGWGVYTYTTPWRSNLATQLVNNTVNSHQFGSAVRIDSARNLIYVGNPGSANVKVFSNTGQYINTITGDAGFGTSIDAQGNLLVVGAPVTGNVSLLQYSGNAIIGKQILTNAGGNVIAASQDQEWVYSANTISGKVNAYTHDTVTYLNVGNNVTVAINDVIHQSNVNGYITATGNVAYVSTGNVISLRDVVGTFQSNVGNVLLNGFGNTYVYKNAANLTANVSSTSTAVQYLVMGVMSGTGSNGFGAALKTNSDGSLVYVGAPLSTNTYAHDGSVYVYARSGRNFTLTETLTSQYKNQNAKFGTSLAVDSTVGNLYIGVPGSSATGQNNGLVERWVLDGTYVYDQSIVNPNADVGAFGTSISVSGDAKVLAVGSQGSSSEETTTFDKNATTIDSTTTKFIDHILNSGATYIFEPVVDPLVAESLGKYVYIQELEAQVYSGDQFGSAIDVTRNLVAVGAPGSCNGTGTAFTFINSTQAPAWSLTRNQQPMVDIDSISRTFIYNKTNNNILSALDYIDPAKGKILNSVAQDIDYQLDRDPAVYNKGTGTINSDLHWGSEQVGQIWWNLDTVRYINYEQDSLNYRLHNWGKQFPNSSVDVYQWVQSSVPPAQYVGKGTPFHIDNSAYCTESYVDQTGSIKVNYYFWVKGLDTVSVSIGKSNSVISITAAIENPQSQGIPYVEILQNNAVALYNVNNLLTGKNSVVHLGSTNGETQLIHSEYALVQEGNPQSQIPNTILNKLVDSLAGIDRIGQPVPDPTLPPSQAYGISIRPRQTMIMDQTRALANYFNLVNNYLISYPVVERKVLTTLNSSELPPLADSDNYDFTVATFEELGYISLTGKSLGYRVLVTSDITNLGKWAIYTLGIGNTWTIATRPDLTPWVQLYKTNLYWTYADWYDYTQYDPTSTATVIVANRLELGKLTLVAGESIKVLDNGNGSFVVYLVDSSLNLILVGIQHGTIQLTTGTIPGRELRQILTAMQKEIFIDDLAAEYNNVFFTMIKYILTEQKNIDWAFKTSFISATQQIRKLKQFPAYIPDNQSFYLDYINEVKPYRTVVREFIADYVGNDIYNGDTTDFDLPAYYDANLQMYRSPSGEQSYDSTIRSQGVYSQWNQNYKYQVVDIIVENSGTGFAYPPDIALMGGGGSGATAYAELDQYTGIASIIITNPGTGYTSTPTVIINGAGTGAVARAVLRNVYDGNSTGHNVVRSIETTMKFDRTTYTNSNTFVQWNQVTANQVIAANCIIVLNETFYKIDHDYTVDGNLTFPTTGLTPVPADQFNNANDRIIAYKGNVDLRNIGDGITYPGVILDGNTYVGSEYDNLVQNFFTSNVGVDPSSLVVDGGKYVGTYSSHAPEELVPGRMYDALSMTVYQTDQIGFRVFEDMNQNPIYYRIAEANTTVLTSNLSLTDSNIHVINASVLPEPNPASAIPGVIFINGEKIVYYVRDTVNNLLGQIRRAVDGTSPQVTHAIGSRVVDASINQEIPYSVTSAYELVSNTGFQTTETQFVTLGLRLTGNISANIGDIIQQIDANTQVVAGTFRALETVSNVTVLPVSLISGTVTGLGDVFDSALGFDETGFDNVISPVYVNGEPTGTYVRAPFILANPQNDPNLLGLNGKIYVLPGRRMENGNIWYNSGINTATDGQGLINSVTAAGLFLKASPSFSIPPGTAP